MTEISFQKRYVLIYALIIAATQHILININSIIENSISSYWAIDVIVLVMMLLILSLFDREQKERIALGFFYRKKPFERGDKWINNDSRIKNKAKVRQKLKNIKNEDFFYEYYYKVKDIKSVNAKNEEYCVIRDITFVLFIMLIGILILTSIWTQYFWKELIAVVVAYLVAIISTNRKAKEFICQIIVEKICLEGEEYYED